jgi:hypothetical protein
LQCSETTSDMIIGLRLTLVCFALGLITWHVSVP